MSPSSIALPRAHRLAKACLKPCLLAVLIPSMLMGSAHATKVTITTDDGPASSAPLPRGWHQPKQHGSATQQAHPLWGVPSFDAPSASHCARPPKLTQDDGRQPSQAKGWHDRRGHAEHKAARADSSTASPRAADVTGAAAAAAPLASSITDDSAAPKAMAQSRVQHAPVTAGMVDDNADFANYLTFVNRQQDASLRTRDIAERYRVEVRDDAGRPVADAELALSWPGAGEGLVWARSDAGGTAWLHPRVLLAPKVWRGLQQFDVLARNADGVVARSTLQRGQKAAVSLRVTTVDTLRRGAKTPLDLVFMVDATGSMADEINKLRSSMKSMVDRIAALPGGIDLCFGLVAYRDHGEEFLTRTYDLSNDLPAFQSVLSSLKAAAGGDEPEAVNEALARTVHQVSWRGTGTSRLVVMIGDAPPHLDQDAPFHDQSAAAALARGIKVHTVGASGLNKQGEAVFRSIAQSTGGRFVFLTYQDARHPSRGPGTDTPHDVRDYSVATLDDLIVRLVSDEVTQRTMR
jgi:von Willebrand factor type A domain